MISEYIRSQSVLKQLSEETESLVTDEYHRKENLSRFAQAEERFNKDWAIFCDKLMPKKIARLKEDTDRLYKKLQLVSTNRVIGAVRSAEASNATIGNTFDGATGFLISLAGAVGQYQSAKYENAQALTANELQSAIARNEEAIDYYNDLCEEFEGVDQQTARDQRLTRLFGTSDSKSLPQPVSEGLNDSVKAIYRTCDNFGCLERELDQHFLSARRASIFLGLIGLLLIGLICSIVHYASLPPTCEELESEARSYVSKHPAKKHDKTKSKYYNKKYFEDILALEKKAEDGDSTAELHYAFHILYLKKDKEMYPLAVSYLEDSAEKGNGLALEFLGDFYLGGQFGCEKDTVKAYGCYCKALEKCPENAYVKFMIGQIKIFSKGQMRDFEGGAQFMREAALDGFVRAWYSLGIFMLAEDVPDKFKNKPMGFKWLVRASFYEVPDACKAYANELEFGRYVQKDVERSQYWRQKYLELTNK